MATQPEPVTPDWYTPGTPQVIGVSAADLTDAERTLARRVVDLDAYPDTASPQTPPEDT